MIPEYANKDNIIALWNNVKSNFVQAAPFNKGDLLYWAAKSETLSAVQPSRLNIPTGVDRTKAVLGVVDGVPAWKLLETSLDISDATTPRLTMNVYGQSNSVNLPKAAYNQAGIVSTKGQEFAGVKTFLNHIILGSPASYEELFDRKASLFLYNNNGMLRHVFGISAATEGQGINDLIIGYDIYKDNAKTRIFGHSIEFMHGTAQIVGMILHPEGTLSVVGNIESTEGGVSAMGIGNLSISAGGGIGTAIGVKFESEEQVYPSDVNGVIELPDYPSLDDYALSSDVERIYATQAALGAVISKIPTQASSSNQLADKAFVNSSIHTATASFLGTNTTASSETEFLAWDALQNANLNDYAFWRTTDDEGNTIFKRYKYGKETVSGTLSWKHEYDLNNSSFTAAQWASISSGITENIRKNVFAGTTSKGDLIYYTGQYAPERLSIGSVGQFLGVTDLEGGKIPKWQSFSKPSLVAAQTDKIATLTVTVQGKTSDVETLPLAQYDKAGIVTAELQTFGGNKIFSNGLTLAKQQPLRVTDSVITVNPPIYGAVDMDSNNILRFGYGTATAGFETWIYGKLLKLYTGTTPACRMTVLADGKVGIGIEAPTATLHVSGTFKIDGNSTLQNVLPKSNNGYNLGSSSLYWKDIFLKNLIAAATLSMYIGGTQKATLTTTGLGVFGGVSANGIDSLAVSAGGGTGTAVGVKFESNPTIYPADVNGVVELPDYPKLDDYALKSWVQENYVNQTDVQGLSQKNWTIGGTAYGIFAKSAMPKLYAKNMTINGADHSFLSLNQSAAFDIYAPITAGISGQLLCSSGDGVAPGWMDQSDVIAGNLAGTILNQNTEFSSRPTAETTDINTGSATLQVIKGNSVVWNQLIKNPNFESTDDWYTVGGNFSVVNNICNFLATQSSANITSNIVDAPQSQLRADKYYFSIWVKRSATTGQISVRVLQTDTQINTAETIEWQRISGIATRTGVNNVALRVLDFRESGWDEIQIRDAVLTNLTKMFGMGNEPQFVADFEKLYNPISAVYDTGHMLSLSATNIKTIGFNIWDEQWENAALNYYTGKSHPSSAHVCSKNYIPIFPNTWYYRQHPYVDAVGQINRVAFYDVNKKYLGNIGWSTFSGSTLFKTPDSAYYMKFYVSAPFYNGDICINLSHSGSKNGLYEHYFESRLPLNISTARGKKNGAGESLVVFPDGLKSAGQAYDEINGRRAIKRIGKVMLGDKNIYAAYPAEGLFGVQMDLQIVNATQNVISSHYVEGYEVNLAAFRANAKSGMMYVNNSDTTRYIYIKDDAFVNLSNIQVKELLTQWEAVAYFELDNYEEYILDAEIGGEYHVNDWGTEVIEPINEGTPITTPLRADIQYGLNAADTVKNVPATYQPLRNRVDSIDGAYSQLYPSVKAVWDFVSLAHGKSGNEPSDPVDSHIIQVGANKLYIKFNAATEGGFCIEVADALVGGNRQSFAFGTISENDINDICRL